MIDQVIHHTSGIPDYTDGMIDLQRDYSEDDLVKFAQKLTLDFTPGSDTITEAYALYNLARARFSLGSCDGVAGLLDRSEAIQGERKEIDRLRKQVEKQCSD